MENLKIIEYTPAYAGAVAEMWQKSTEGWNGGNGNETEETIEAFDIFTNSSFLYGSDSIEFNIQVYTDFNKCVQWGFLNTTDFAWMNSRYNSLASGEKMFLPNVFYIFTKEHISDKLLKNLENVVFE